MDREYTDFGVLFQQIIYDLKGSCPLWEDFIKQSSKFHSTLKYTMMNMSSFLESFQKLGDFAMDAKGGPKDIGSSIIKLALRHRAIENHLKLYTNALMESLIIPLQEKLDEWKKNVLHLDKEHNKECKRMQGEVKKASCETLKLQKKVNKGKYEAKSKLELSLRDFNAKMSTLEMTERNAIVAAITEHRSRYSNLISYIKPVMIHEMAMVGELDNFREVLAVLEGQVANPSGMIEQSFTDAVRGFHSTIERKKRVLKDDVELMGTLQRSASTCSYKSDDPSITTKNTSCDVISMIPPASTTTTTPTTITTPVPHMTRAPPDDIQNSPVFSMTVDENFFFKQEFASMEMSSHAGVSDGGPRPQLTADTFVPPPAVQQQQMQQLMMAQRQSFSSTNSLSSSSSAVSEPGSKKVEKIYARPSLVKRGDNYPTAPLPVAAPVVPDVTFLSSISSDINKRQETSGFATTRTQMSIASNNSTNYDEDDDVYALNQAIADLEKNTKLLESSYHPCPATSLQSLQSLQSVQCSSGYGTMTNVSTTSDETIPTSAELDALLEPSLSDLEKCSTLPFKRFNHSKADSDIKRPASSSDEIPTPTIKTHYPFPLVHDSSGDFSNFPPPMDEGDSALMNITIVGDNLPLPPPPPEDFLLSNPCDSFPLPPPPVALENYHPATHQQQTARASTRDATTLRQKFTEMQHKLPTLEEQKQQTPRSIKPKPPPPKPFKSTAPRADIMQNLSDVLKIRRASLRTDDDDDYSPVTATTTMSRISKLAASRGSDPSLPESSESESSNLGTLLRNVTLRRTICHDRSAPVLKKY